MKRVNDSLAPTEHYHMGVAKPVQVSAGKTDPSQIYIQITNKDIYRLNKKIDLPDVASLIASIQAANKVRLHNWTKVEKRAPQTASLSPKPLMGADPVAPRHRILAEFKAKCDKADHAQLTEWHGTKLRKASNLEAVFETFQNTMSDTENDWLELDRIQRLLDVVTTERDYAKGALS